MIIAVIVAVKIKFINRKYRKLKAIPFDGTMSSTHIGLMVNP